MAIVTRKDSDGKPIYWIVFPWQGKRVWERAGRDHRGAERLEAQRKREVKAGTYQPKGKATTFAQYGQEWAERRKGRNAKDERAALRRYVFARSWLAELPLRELRPKHMIQLVAELGASVSEETEKPLSPKTVANVYGVVRTMIGDALRLELVDVDPCRLPPGTFRRKKGGKAREVYGEADVVALVTDARLSIAQRVFNAIAFFTGMREGEICGLRWSDYDDAPAPLAALSVERQYEGRLLKTEKAEGEQPRRVPVHPVLRQVLDAWEATGFELTFLRAPRPGDPIAPTGALTPHTKSTAYKAWRRACEATGVENRSLHSTRHTFISMCRRGGARKDVVERITHNAKGDIVDAYTHWDWDPLCEAVLCLKLGLVAALPAAGESTSDPAPSLPSHVGVGTDDVDSSVDSFSGEAGKGCETVEAPGIEERASSESSGTDGNGEESEAEAEPPKTRVGLVAGADRSARQQPPPICPDPSAHVPSLGQLINARASAGAKLVEARERRARARREDVWQLEGAVCDAVVAYEDARGAELAAQGAA